MDKSDLAMRMKEYEMANQRYLTRRMPVIQRYDGCHFHTFTRKFKRPFDDILLMTMQQTMKYLCENIQGAVCGYTESDEITLVLVDYKNLNSSAWFNNRQNKMESVGASMCTMAFNKFFRRNVECFAKEHAGEPAETEYIEALQNAVEMGALFDCRTFNIPEDDVTNCFYWRQLDASRNSVQMVGQANFSHRELQNQSCNAIIDMLMLQKGIDWNDFPTEQKRGSCCIKKNMPKEIWNRQGELLDIKNVDTWIIDSEIPIFIGEGREYIEKWIRVEE